MKSWIDLTEEEQNNYMEEFNKKYNGPSSMKLHEINKCLLIFIVPLSLFIIMRIIVGTADNILFIEIITGILIFIYIFNIIRIKKINNDFVKWLQTKNIIK